VGSTRRVSRCELRAGQVRDRRADPIRTLDAIVALSYDMGFIALGRVKREREQAHDQVIAVGFDRTGHPTWTRLLDHFRAMQIYGGAVHPGTPGAAHFVARIPIGGEDPSALAWIKMYPGSMASSPRISSRARSAGRAPGSSRVARMRRSPRTGAPRPGSSGGCYRSTPAMCGLILDGDAWSPCGRAAPDRVGMHVFGVGRQIDDACSRAPSFVDQHRPRSTLTIASNSRRCACVNSIDSGSASPSGRRSETPTAQASGGEENLPDGLRGVGAS
jgi:hypothetical protein